MQSRRDLLSTIGSLAVWSLCELAVSLLLPGCRPVVGTACTRAGSRPTLDGLIDVGGGRSLHIHCLGEGTPLVVMDSGFGCDGGEWDDVQPAVGRFTRACSYDRAGMGDSEGQPPAPSPHRNEQMAAELHALLDGAGLGGPYVMVGHSMGGINVRLFASEHLEEVAGMVLVDATVDPMRSRALLSPEELAASRAGFLAAPEGIDLDILAAGAADMRASSISIGDRPLVVLTRGKEKARPGATPERTAEMLRVWQDLQASVPSLSTNAVQVVAENSGHMIPLDAPELVVAAIREVVEAARAHRRVQPGALLPFAKEGT